ncbi:MAG: hypothetical protein IJY12_01925 [Clostridia bacterium]|nr:hypothetical protein [Clostridia bacterium]
MANAKTVSKLDPKKFLTVAIITTFTTAILSRLCYILYNSAIYDTSVSDTLFSLIDYLSTAMFSVSRGIIFAITICAFFLDRHTLYKRTLWIASGGIALFQLSGFFIDLVNGLWAETWFYILLYHILQILIDLALELLILALILHFGFKNISEYQPVKSVFSVKNPPQKAALIFSLIYFAEFFCLYLYDTVVYLLDDYTLVNPELFFEVFSEFLHTAIPGFVIPYAVITFALRVFQPENIKN